VTTATTHLRICPLCEATCGLRLTLADDRVTKVDGDDDGVFSGGYLCPKGVALADLHGSNRCTLQVGAADAAELGLSAGATARVASRTGEVEVEVVDDLLRGVVSLPHGWGHDRPGSALPVASRRPGVNSNLLTDPEAIDPLSGNAVLNAIPVSVSAVASRTHTAKAATATAT
jgi:anaerobic selenocysteine-containing dehydrogenase